MDTAKNVVIIMDVMRFTKDMVVKDLTEEGYPYNFFFVNFDNVSSSRHAVEHADEIWLWGDCTGNMFYELAKKKGADLWNMKR